MMMPLQSWGRAKKQARRDLAVMVLTVLIGISAIAPVVGARRRGHAARDRGDGRAN